jgi:hypothetical protein
MEDEERRWRDWLKLVEGWACTAQDRLLPAGVASVNSATTTTPTPADELEWEWIWY